MESKLFSFTLKFKAMKTLGNNFLKERLSTSVIVLLFTLLGSCSKSSSYTTPSTGGNGGNGGNGGPPASEVWIQGSAFNPVTLTVAVNTTVKWTNKDGITHTVTSDSNLFDSGNLSSNGTFPYTFTTKGTFTYHCNIHPMMMATVIVQ
jgi:plastocyanin